MNIPDDVERCALIGWKVYPVSPVSKKACVKQPTESATDDLDQISGWCRDFPGCNWRVVFGPSGLLGLDLDVPPLHAHDGVTNFSNLVEANTPLPPHPRLRSGGGGQCLFFRHQGERIVGKEGNPVPGADPRRGRQSQSIPPSLHWKTKLSYTWIVPPWEVTPPPAPDWLLKILAPAPDPVVRPESPLRTGDQLRNYAVGALRNAIRRVATAGKGGRNNALNAEAWSMARFVRDGALTASEVRDSLSAAARANGLAAEDGIRAVLMTIDSGLTAPVA